ncbi:MAG TPA: hypothetical protein DCS23_01570 [Candidatus Yonathbacteria bacterium]|nr:hypothetical protein [Candidatus Yonathbacteria bacterium]
MFSLFPPYFINHGVYGRKIKKLFLDDNSVATGEILETTLQYEWSTDKLRNLRELEQKAKVGNQVVEAHYDIKKNVTKIKKKLKETDGEETKESFDGLIILMQITEKGVVRVDY